MRGFGDVDGYQFFSDFQGRLDMRTYQLAATQRTSTAIGSIVAGNWYTTGFSRSGAVVTIYRNGVEITAIIGVHIDPATCAREGFIGILHDRVQWPFDGKMEFLRVFGGIALSASEHLAWHNALA